MDVDDKVSSGTSDHTTPRTGLISRLKKHLLHDDPNDAITLQPYIQERLTKKAELWAFFLFGFGYFGWSNTTGALFQPLLVQQVARGASHLSSDLITPCPSKDAEIPVGDKCVVPFGFIYVEPTSYTLLINVVSVWCTIVVSLGTSAFADHGRSSRKLMMTFCLLLAVTTAFMFIGPLKPEVWWISGFLMVVGLIFNGVTLNFFDAHIPILARFHPTVIKAMVDHGADSQEHVKAKVQVATFLSGGASAAGYAGGFLLTLLATLVIIMTDASPLVLGYCLIMSSVFVLIFMIAYAFLSHQRTSPPLPEGANVFTFGYVRIGKTMRQVRRLKTMFFYLCAWFILGDGLTSATSMAILIAQDQLRVSNDALIIAALIQYIFAGCSMWFWIWLQNSKGVKPMKVIIINSCLFGLIPIYCLLGLIKSNPVGLKHTWELYLCASLFGLFIGAINSSNRVVFSQFIPLGHENELYAVFEMANVSSSWIGPLICTAIIERAGIRHTWWFLLTQFYIPAIMMVFVNVEKGRQEAIDFYNNEQAEKARAKQLTDMTVLSDSKLMGSEKDLNKSV
ncbi:autophagy-related protein 22-like protein [Gamsiella multidivaricata]|uniref:autophagy-related protein 22-like protein n=1 Tax=Gamsiella multidivaricata TaxID=101098 RepID=UPI00221F4FA1|nr:autophagy-related protein 22-like protein [Gamsiella multidivaricata]KAG0367288.1 Autophagy protein 22 [Gamsiella multidivaricata]KAI7821061.1 autophagy-related protein 22-like protein [Gamsiella multidivaricata]